jgi:hypothetical protein
VARRTEAATNASISIPKVLTDLGPSFEDRVTKHRECRQRETPCYTKTEEFRRFRQSQKMAKKPGYVLLGFANRSPPKGVCACCAESAVPNAPGGRRVPVQRILPEPRQEWRHQRRAEVPGSLSEPGRPTSARDGTSRRQLRSRRSLIGYTRTEYR